MNARHGAADKAGRADALEEQITREIVTAGFERPQRWIERGFDLDERARRRRHAALDRQPHAARHLIDTATLDAVDAQHETVGMLTLLAQLDKPGHRHAGGREAQHRMIDQRRFERRHGKAESDGEEAERDHTQYEALRHEAPAQ